MRFKGNKTKHDKISTRSLNWTFPTYFFFLFGKISPSNIHNCHSVTLRLDLWNNASIVNSFCIPWSWGFWLWWSSSFLRLNLNIRVIWDRGRCSSHIFQSINLTFIELGLRKIFLCYCDFEIVLSILHFDWNIRNFHFEKKIFSMTGLMFEPYSPDFQKKNYLLKMHKWYYYHILLSLIVSIF